MADVHGAAAPHCHMGGWCSMCMQLAQVEGTLARLQGFLRVYPAGVQCAAANFRLCLLARTPVDGENSGSGPYLGQLGAGHRRLESPPTINTTSHAHTRSRACLRSHTFHVSLPPSPQHAGAGVHRPEQPDGQGSGDGAAGGALPGAHQPQGHRWVGGWAGGWVGLAILPHARTDPISRPLCHPAS